MLRIADGQRSPCGEPNPGMGGEESVPSLGCRTVQIALTLYLTPVILLVLAIGGVSVLTSKIARAAAQVIRKKPERAIGPRPIVGPFARRDEGRPHSSSRGGRTRAAR